MIRIDSHVVIILPSENIFTTFLLFEKCIFENLVYQFLTFKIILKMKKKTYVSKNPFFQVVTNKLSIYTSRQNPVENS